MKKLRTFLTMFLMVFALALGGCSKNQEPTIDNKEIFEDDLQPLEDDELALMDDPEVSDDEMTFVDDDTMDSLESGDATEIVDAEDAADTQDEISGIEVEEDGTYTSKDEVAVYIHQFGKLPSNYITKKEAQELGWNSKEGNLDEVAPGKSIGGDRFGNYEKMLPEEDGRTYKECDIDFDGGYRNEKRIIYSNDGLIFYTGDHYETFEQLY